MEGTPTMTVPESGGAVDDPRQAALDALLTRQSNNMLQDPVPSGRDLDLILEAAVRAPDHGRLYPWRFVVIQGDAREAYLKVVQDAARTRDPSITEKQLADVGRKTLSAPMIIAIAAKVVVGKYLEIEQVLSAGAAAMNMLNAIHLLGYAGKWVTGASCYDPNVAAALGIQPPDRLVGFLYVGTPRMAMPPYQRPAGRDFAEEWEPQAATRA